MNVTEHLAATCGECRAKTDKKAKIKGCLEMFLGRENPNSMWKEKNVPHLPALHQSDCLLNKCVTEMDERVTCLFHVLHAAGGQVHTVTYKDATWQALMVFRLWGEAESGGRLQCGTAVISCWPTGSSLSQSCLSVNQFVPLHRHRNPKYWGGPEWSCTAVKWNPNKAQLNEH